ncbi:MAG: FlgO family outer membrane protein [Glaciecola sp.]
MKALSQQTSKLISMAACVALLSGCAAGKMFMAGYTPPQTIADLINEQYALAGELPPELDPDKRDNKPITLDASLVRTSNDTSNNSGEQDYTLDAPVQRFNPRFTYKSVQDYAGQLAMQLVKNGNGLNTRAKIGVSAFVKLDTTLQNTTVLGNQLAEYSISEIQQFGLHVIDFKLMPAIKVTRGGDLAYSRNVVELAESSNMNHVLSGTMIQKREGIFVNARIIELGSSKVVSTASVLIPRFVADQASPQFVSYGAE